MLFRSAVALVAGEIAANSVAEVCYDGTQFQLLSPAVVPGATVPGPILAGKGANIAAAATVDLSTATGNEVHITGTGGPITSFGTVAAGAEFILIFDSTPTVTYNATSLIIPGGASLTVAAGDVWRVVSEGSGNWRITGMQLSSGQAPVSSASPPVGSARNARMSITAASDRKSTRLNSSH